MAQLVNSWREDTRTFKHKNPQKSINMFRKLIQFYIY